MELGALVCLPDNPNCSQCPFGIANVCEAKKKYTNKFDKNKFNNLIFNTDSELLGNTYGRRAKKKEVPTKELNVFIPIIIEKSKSKIGAK